MYIPDFDFEPLPKAPDPGTIEGQLEYAKHQVLLFLHIAVRNVPELAELKVKDIPKVIEYFFAHHGNIADLDIGKIIHKATHAVKKVVHEGDKTGGGVVDDVTGLPDDIKKLPGDVKNLANQVSKIGGEVKTLTSQVSKVTGDLKTVTDQVSSLAKSVSDLKAGQDLLNTDLKNFEKGVENLIEKALESLISDAAKKAFQEGVKLVKELPDLGYQLTLGNVQLSWDSIRSELVRLEYYSESDNFPTDGSSLAKMIEDLSPDSASIQFDFTAPFVNLGVGQQISVSKDTLVDWIKKHVP